MTLVEDKKSREAFDILIDQFVNDKDPGMGKAISAIILASFVATNRDKLIIGKIED